MTQEQTPDEEQTGQVGEITNDTLKNLDIIIKQYGIKYIFVESGRLSVEQKCKELNINPNDYPTAMFWCELSWG